MFTDCFLLRFPVTQLFGCEPPSCHHQNPSSVIFLQFDSQSSSVSLSHRPTLLTVLPKPLRDCHHTDSVCVFQRAPCFHGVHKPSHKSSHNVVLSGLRILRAGPGCLRMHLQGFCRPGSTCLCASNEACCPTHTETESFTLPAFSCVPLCRAPLFQHAAALPYFLVEAQMNSLS